MRLVNLRGELVEVVNGESTRIDNTPLLVVTTDVTSRIAIIQDGGRLYDIDSLQYRCQRE